MSLLIRERAPLRLDVDIATPDNHHARWGLDERSASNVSSALAFSSTMPGGYEQMSCVLERQPERAYSDLEELSTITVHGAGGHIAWQGRLERAPRASGDQLSISPAAVGWQAHLEDDASARMIYIDIDHAHWQAPSAGRSLLMAPGATIGAPQVLSDQSSGAPSVQTAITRPWSLDTRCEAWYDSKGAGVFRIYYAWAANANVQASDTHVSWYVAMSDDDLASAQYVDTGSLRTAVFNSGLFAPALSRFFASVALRYDTALAGGENSQWAIDWTDLTVVGPHGLPIHGSQGLVPGGVGFFASDIIAHAVQTWAPKLNFSTGTDGSIRPSTFLIPHLVFTDPSTVSQIVKAASAFGLPDWGVWDGPSGPTFYCADRGTFAKHWRARVYPAKLQETGPQVDRLYNGVLVSFSDVTGITRTVGPPGSGADSEDVSLLDPDPLNPVNEAGIKRYTLLQMGTSTAAGAIKVGATFLQAQKELDSSGQASLTGHVEDDHGVLWPAWRVRAGDDITFIDASDPSPRRVINASYDDPSKTCTVQLDAPPQGLQWLLARLGAAVQPLGF